MVFMFTVQTGEVVGYWTIFVVFPPLVCPLKFCFITLQSTGVVPLGFVKPECCLDALTIVQL